MREEVFMRKRWIGIGLVLALVMIFFAGCAKSSKEVKLSFWIWDGSPEYSETYKSQIAEYKKLAPNVTIDFLGLPFDSALDKLNTALATKTSPDVAAMGMGWVANFYYSKALTPLDKYFDASKLKDVADKKTFDTGVVNGTRVGIPTDFTLLGTWYNTELFKQLNLQIPTSYSEYFADIRAITKSKKAYGFSLRGGFGSTYMLDGYLISYVSPKSYFDENGKVFLRDPKAREGFKKYIGLYKTDTAESDINNGFKEMVREFDSGAAGIILHNISSEPLHAKSPLAGKYGFFILPKADNGVQTISLTNVAATSQLAVFNSCKNPAEAWKFIEFLMNDANIGDFNMKTGTLPCTTSAQKADWIKNNPTMAYTVKVLQDPNIQTVAAPLHMPDYDNIHQKILMPGLQEVLAGKRSADEYFDQWISLMEKAYQDYLAVVKK
jgi:multiple sugar transport system substrate-binding protein